MRAIGLDPEAHPELRADRLLHLARGAAARLRAGADAARTRPRATITRPPATCCGSATAPASSAARMSNSAAACRNPIGLKCGPSIQPDELMRLIDALDPAHEPGRLTLICRFGADKIEAALPPLIRAVQARGPQGRVGLRPDARQHDQDRDRLQDPAVRPHPVGNPLLLRRPSRAKAPMPAASIWR